MQNIGNGMVLEFLKSLSSTEEKMLRIFFFLDIGNTINPYMNFKVTKIWCSYADVSVQGKWKFLLLHAHDEPPFEQVLQINLKMPQDSNL